MLLLSAYPELARFLDPLTAIYHLIPTWDKAVLVFACLMILVLILEAVWSWFFQWTPCGRRIARRFRESMRRNNKEDRKNKED
jgi:hypothetical protein